MTETSIFDKSLGIVFILGQREQKNWIDILESEWYNSAFHRALYEGFVSISDECRMIDLLSITQWLRENDRLSSHDWIVKISNISSDVDFTDTVNQQGLWNECFYHYSLRQVMLMLQNVNNEVSEGQPRQHYILEEIDKVKNVLTTQEVEGELTNADSIDEVLDKHQNAKLGIPIGLELGWETLNGKLILEPDDVMIVGGRPAMGKTAWSITLLKKLCFDMDKVVIFYSLEMSKDRIIRRLLSLITGIDSNRIKYGQCTQFEIDQISELKSIKEWSNLYVIDGSQNVKDIEHHINRIKVKHENIDTFVIDYIQKIMPNKSDTRYQEVTKISNDIKRIVMAHRIPCIALAQLNRDSSRSGRRPTLPDLKESGEIEQDASIVCFLHRPEYYGETVDENGNDMEGIGEFIIAKNRDGVVGITEMKVDLPTSNWMDYDRFNEQLHNVNNDHAPF